MELRFISRTVPREIYQKGAPAIKILQSRKWDARGWWSDWEDVPLVTEE